MPSENFRRPERVTPRRSIDGFITGGTQNTNTPRATSPFMRRRPASHMPQHPAPAPYSVRQHLSPYSRGQRPRFDDFRRPVASRPPATVTSNLQVQPPLTAPKPAIPVQSADVKPTGERTIRKRYGRNRAVHGRHGSRVRRMVLRTALATGLVLVLLLGFLFGKGYFQLKHIFHGGAPVAALQADVDPSQLKGEGDGRVNILLMGIGGAGHDGPDLTDTLLVASVDPVNDKIGLLSVPRDLWIKQPDNFMGTYQKINAAYEAGKYDYLNEENASNANEKAVQAGFKTADTAVSQVLGIPIDYNVLVDFQAFQQAIDTVGGVSIDVPAQLYDPTMAWENGWNPVLAQPGWQTMGGKQALLYARSRETSSDFARTERQRAILMALKDKVLSAGTLSNPFKISKLMSAFGDNVKTDLSLTDAEALYGLMKKVSSSNTQSFSLDNAAPNNFVTTTTMDGVSAVVPTAGTYDYSQIQSYVRNVLKDGYLAKENAKIMVLNGTAQAGLATQEADTLKSYGYNVTAVNNAPTQTYGSTVLVDLTHGVDKYTKNYLQKRFGVTAVTALPDKAIQPNGANFVIIVGQDEADTSASA